MKVWGLVLLMIGHLAFANDQELSLDDPELSTPLMGQPKAPTMPVISTSQDQDEESSARLHVGLGLAYTTNGLMKFDPVVFSDGSIFQETTAEFNFSNAFSFDAEVRYIEKYSLGFIAGTTIDQERKLKSGKMTGTTWIWTLLPFVEMKLKISTYYLSAVYRSDEFYFPFGLNLCTVQVSSPVDQFGNMSATGGIGWQAGIGFYLTDHVVLEFISRKAAFKLTSQYEDGSTIDFGQGGFYNISFGAKAIF